MLTLAWFIWGRNLALHSKLESVKSLPHEALAHRDGNVVFLAENIPLPEKYSLTCRNFSVFFFFFFHRIFSLFCHSPSLTDPRLDFTWVFLPQFTKKEQEWGFCCGRQ